MRGVRVIRERLLFTMASSRIMPLTLWKVTWKVFAACCAKQGIEPTPTCAYEQREKQRDCIQNCFQTEFFCPLLGCFLTVSNNCLAN